MSRQSYIRSFAGGEITAELFGRLDLAKNQTGLAKCLNFIVLPHGPIANRPGWEYTIETKDSNKASVLLPFIYSTTQSYVLEFGDYYMRIHTQGATVLSAVQNVTAISQANPGVLTYDGADPANGTWVWLSGIGGMTELNGRYVVVSNVNAGANTFEMTDFAGAAIDTTAYSAYTSGGTIAPVYEIATPYAVADLFDLHYTQSSDVLTLVNTGYQQRQLSRLGAASWSLATFTLAPTIATPGAPTVVAGAGSGSTTYTYVTTAVATEGLEESLQSPSANCTNDLTTAGSYNNVTPAAVSGAVRYNVYKLISGLYGYIGQTDGSAFKDDNIQPDLTRTPPLGNDPFVGAGNYPAAVAYQDGRRWFAGTSNKKLNLWGTRSGTESNLAYSIPTQADDSIAVRLTAQQAGAVRHLVPFDDLLAFTDNAVWVVNNGGAGGPITPENVTPRRRGTVGASNVQPVATATSVIYIQARGAKARELAYNWQVNGYTTKDISVMAPHLFRGYTITSMTYAHSPFQCVWCTRSDGVLLGMTYLPEHEIVAWHRHNTAGYYESVVSVPEGEEDALYAIIRRAINGRTVRNVERMHSRVFDSLADCFFVDSGLTYDGPPTATITNLWHLEGEEVAILADGAVHPARTVAGGSITLEHEASVVHVGLGYNADAETLPLVLEKAAGFGQHAQKNVNRVGVRVHDSSGLFVGPSFDKLRENKQRTAEVYGEPPVLVSGMREVTLTPEWGNDGSICLRQANPLPLTVVALVPDTSYGD